MRIKVSFEIEAPDIDHTPRELRDWIEFEYRYSCGLESDNPFYDFEPEPIKDTLCISESDKTFYEYLGNKGAL